MYFFKIALLNVIRQKKYSFPFFVTMCTVCFAITVVIGIHTYSVSQIENISKNYITTVTPIYYPIKSQTNNPQNITNSVLVSEDIELLENNSEVKLISYSQPCSFSFYLWQMLYSSDDFSDDIIITDTELMNTIYSQSILNSEFCDSVEIVDGTYIPNDINSDNTIPILISDYISSKTGIKVSDTITISHDSDRPMQSNQFIVNGIFVSNFDSEKYLIYIPYLVSKKFHENNGIVTASSHLDYLFDVKFVLEKSDAAEPFIRQTFSYFQDKGYILQANDYEYKKEVYPLKMMLQMNNIIGVAIIFISLSILFILTLHSIRIKRSEFTVFRLLSLPSKILIGIYIVEKCIIFFPSSVIGFLIGGILLNIALGICSAKFFLYSITMIISLHIFLLLLCFFLYINIIRQPLMGEIANGK